MMQDGTRMSFVPDTRRSQCHPPPPRLRVRAVRTWSALISCTCTRVCLQQTGSHCPYNKSGARLTSSIRKCLLRTYPVLIMRLGASRSCRCRRASNHAPLPTTTITSSGRNQETLHAPELGRSTRMSRRGFCPRGWSVFSGLLLKLLTANQVPAWARHGKSLIKAPTHRHQTSAKGHCWSLGSFL